MRLERGDLSVALDVEHGVTITYGKTERISQLEHDELTWLMTAALPAAIVAMRPAPESVRPVASPIDGQLPLG